MNQKGRGNKTDAIDRDLLHQYLYKKSDRHHMITISPSVLADELGITIFSMSRILAEMKKQGRIKKIGTRIEITDPDVFMWNSTNT